MGRLVSPVGEHAREDLQAARTIRRKAAAAQIPKEPRELEVKKRTESGKLLYAWNGIEVAVTPRERRPDDPEAEGSRSQRCRVRETTPQRAFRKLKRKIERRQSRVFYATGAGVGGGHSL